MTNPAELLQTTFCLVDGIDPRLGLGIASLESILERLEPGVNAQDTCISVSASGTKLAGTWIPTRNWG